MRLVFVALLLSWFWSCLVCMMDWKWLESWGYVAGCSLTSHLTSKIQASNLATIQKGLYIYIGFRGSAVFVVTARLQCLPCLSRDLHMQDLISKAGEVKASSALSIFSFLEGLYTISYYIFPASLSEIKGQMHSQPLQRLPRFIALGCRGFWYGNLPHGDGWRRGFLPWLLHLFPIPSELVPSSMLHLSDDSQTGCV